MKCDCNFVIFLCMTLITIATIDATWHQMSRVQTAIFRAEQLGISFGTFHCVDLLCGAIYKRGLLKISFGSLPNLAKEYFRDSAEFNFIPLPILPVTSADVLLTNRMVI